MAKWKRIGIFKWTYSRQPSISVKKKKKSILKFLFKINKTVNQVNINLQSDMRDIVASSFTWYLSCNMLTFVFLFHEICNLLNVWVNYWKGVQFSFYPIVWIFQIILFAYHLPFCFLQKLKAAVGFLIFPLKFCYLNLPSNKKKNKSLCRLFCLNVIFLFK